MYPNLHIMVISFKKHEDLIQRGRGLYSLIYLEVVSRIPFAFFL